MDSYETTNSLRSFASLSRFASKHFVPFTELASLVPPTRLGLFGSGNSWLRLRYPWYRGRSQLRRIPSNACTYNMYHTHVPYLRIVTGALPAIMASVKQDSGMGVINVHLQGSVSSKLLVTLIAWKYHFVVPPAARLTLIIEWSEYEGYLAVSGQIKT